MVSGWGDHKHVCKERIHACKGEWYNNMWVSSCKERNKSGIYWERMYVCKGRVCMRVRESIHACKESKGRVGMHVRRE